MSQLARRAADSVPDWRILTAIAGLLAAGALFAHAYSIAPQDGASARTLFWDGLTLGVLAFCVALVSRQATPGQLAALCGLLAVTFSVPKFGRAPQDFIFFDELQHVRSVADVLDGMRLFIQNPLNPLATHYPGLSTLTGVLVAASGLSTFAVGNVLMLAARVLMLTSLFVLYRRLFGGNRMAALAALLYAANPAFFFFDAQFSYESLALPLAIAIFTISLTPPYEGHANWVLVALCAALAPAVVVTHHVSSGALVVLFVVFGAALGLFESYRGSHNRARGARPSRSHDASLAPNHAPTHGASGQGLLAAKAAYVKQSILKPLGVQRSDLDRVTDAYLEVYASDNRHLSRRLLILGAFTATLTAFWWALVAPRTWEYLGGDIGPTLRAVIDFFTGGDVRTPFKGSSAFPVPAYEVLISYIGVAVLGLSFVAGTIWAWRYEPLRRSRYVACVVIGCAFFASLPLQLVQEATAAPIAPRIWEIAFVGLAPVAAFALRRIAIIRWWSAGLTAVALVLILGSGVVIRSGDNIRFPGSYVPSSGPRATTPDTIAAARWLARYYGRHRVVMADFTLASVFGAYANSQPASYQNYGIRPWRVFFSNRLTGAGRFELDRSGTEFIVVDRRMTTARPFTKFYFSDTEPALSTPLLPISYLTKFDSSNEFESVYDNGNVLIYRYLGR